VQLQLRADTSSVRVARHELVTSAVECGPKDGTITVRAERTADSFGVTVSDDGQ
jgi:anti-sigma regulatory factor (Ser/Thr protein kinase)